MADAQNTPAAQHSSPDTRAEMHPLPPDHFFVLHPPIGGDRPVTCSSCGPGIRVYMSEEQHRRKCLGTSERTNTASKNDYWNAKLGICTLLDKNWDSSTPRQRLMCALEGPAKTGQSETAYCPYTTQRFSTITLANHRQFKHPDGGDDFPCLGKRCELHFPSLEDMLEHMAQRHVIDHAKVVKNMRQPHVLEVLNARHYDFLVKGGKGIVSPYGPLFAIDNFVWQPNMPVQPLYDFAQEARQKMASGEYLPF